MVSALRRRWNIAWEPIPWSRVVNDFAITFLPCLAAALALYHWAPGELDAMEGIVYPTAFFFITLILVMFVRELGRPLLRFVLGKPANRTRRTFMGADREWFKSGLASDREDISIVRCSYESEVRDFAHELEVLFEDCGWRVQSGTTAYIGEGQPKNISVRQPKSGHTGLEALVKKLNTWGFPATVGRLMESDMAEIEIGDLVR